MDFHPLSSRWNTLRDYSGPILEPGPEPADSAVQETCQGTPIVAVESESQKREFQRWSRLAIQLLGAADSGQFDHITTSVVMRELEQDRLFDLLVTKLPVSVWEISKLTDVDRHKLSHTGA